LLITAAGRGGGDNVLRDNSPIGGAEGCGGGEDDWIALIKPVEVGESLPRVICGDMGGGAGGGKVKDSSVGVVPK